MNDEFMKNIISLFGDEGRKWLDSIPQKIETYKQKWSIEVFPPFVLSYNYVAPVRKNDGRLAVLKIGYPKDKEFQNEIEALEVFNGGGITKLIKSDRKNAVMLIEQVQPGIPLSKIEDDDKATRILASVMKKLWKPLPRDNHFITISEWTKELQEYPDKYKKSRNPPIPLYLVKKALRLFEDLISSPTPSVLVHADLHHDNVLSSDRDGWLAIDPKGIAAEPAYETAAMIRNPYDKLKDMINIEETLRRRILILSEELGFDPKRIRNWCLAQTILSGVWTRDDAAYSKHALKVAQALDIIRI